ncbi:hypothetical protein PR048_028182 [Dryococelus australis]|uniref:Uncharacterized protein n=1 Tax=Dryococelus australis TaxID=614101 RepID=A0ABQ9GIL0_9NEOP|nr:hypothetical protein PR048_028182 [Dryococelus australis]
MANRARFTRVFACGIVLDDAASRRVSSGIFRFPHPCIPVLLHTHLASPSSALNILIGNTIYNQENTAVPSPNPTAINRRLTEFSRSTGEIPCCRGITAAGTSAGHSAHRGGKFMSTCVVPRRFLVSGRNTFSFSRLVAGSCCVRRVCTALSKHQLALQHFTRHCTRYGLPELPTRNALTRRIPYSNISTKVIKCAKNVVAIKRVEREIFLKLAGRQIAVSLHFGYKLSERGNPLAKEQLWEKKRRLEEASVPISEQSRFGLSQRGIKNVPATWPPDSPYAATKKCSAVFCGWLGLTFNWHSLKLIARNLGRPFQLLPFPLPTNQSLNPSSDLASRGSRDGLCCPIGYCVVRRVPCWQASRLPGAYWWMAFRAALNTEVLRADDGVGRGEAGDLRVRENPSDQRRRPALKSGSESVGNQQGSPTRGKGGSLTTTPPRSRRRLTCHRGLSDVDGNELGLPRCHDRERGANDKADSGGSGISARPGHTPIVTRLGWRALTCHTGSPIT